MSEREVQLPKLYDAQQEVDRHPARFKVVACGRRWGKTKLGVVRNARVAIAGHPTAWFAPNYKLLLEPYREMKRRLAPITARCSDQEKRIELITGGSIDFWTLDGEDPARGYKYKRATIDEAAMAKDLGERWNAAIRPTLTDYRGDADFLSTPKGRNFFFECFHNPSEAWQSWQMPSSTNPYLPPDEIKEAENELPASIFAQEYLAEFLADEGAVFRNVMDVVERGYLGAEYDSSNAYTVGVDLARVQDFTVLSCFDAHGKQVAIERFNSTSWQMAIQRVAQMCKRYGDAPAVVDATGLGDPICEALRAEGVTVRPYHFTNASKTALIENAQLRFERRDITLIDNNVQTGEFLIYEYDKTPSGTVRMNAPEGKHDDCVIATCLALWGSAKTKAAKKDKPWAKGTKLI